MNIIIDKNYASKLGSFKVSTKKGNPLIVFLNGAGSFDTEQSFRVLINLLPKEYGIFAPDYLNTGFSSASKQEYSIEQEAKILVKLINNLKAKKVIIVAHSLGGIYALHMCSKIKNLIGFIGIEPTTREVIANPPKTKEYLEQEQLKPEKFQKLITDKINKLFSKEDAKLLCQSAMNNQQKFTDESSQMLNQAMEKSWDNDLVISDNIPTIIFTEKYRKEEYERSEFLSKNKNSEIICLGDFHYLHWEYAKEIVE